MIFNRFRLKEAILFSNFTIFVEEFLVSIFRKDLPQPYKKEFKRLQMSYFVLMLPIILLGSHLGVMILRLISEFLLTILVTISILGCFVKGLINFCRGHAQEELNRLHYLKTESKLPLNNKIESISF